ncbi:MAG: Glyoxylase, beta-lactamase superfamily II [Chloroflexi bacterium]|nr:MAG: Glyoxylase, beta-lactamase superfamily II [Chloroflexota bacterium]
MTDRPSLLDDRRVLPIALGANWIYALPAADPARDGVLLIDAGPDYDGAWEALVAQLHAAGLNPSQVRTVLITHAHLDHCGLAQRWQQQGAQLAGSADEVSRFLLGDRVARHQADLVVRFMLEAGVPADKLEQIIRRRRDRPASPPRPESPDQRAARQRPSRERWPDVLRGTPFQLDRELADGDEIVVGDRRLRFIAAPGHTPGNAVYLEEAQDAAGASLFSGDQLLPHITPNPGLHFHSRTQRFRSLPAYTRSLERIATLGAQHLYPGHGEPRDGSVQDAIDRTLSHHTKRQQRVLHFLRDGPLSPYQVLAKFFPHLPDARLWQAFAEVIGHIDALVERGEVVEEESESGERTLRRPG